MVAYVLAFMMNVNNFEPVIIKDCSKIDIQSSKTEIQKQVKALESMKMRCEQIEDKLSYACISSNQQIVGRAIILKDLNECKAFPAKISKDMKNLLNIR